jgi:hypothetical protein
MPLVFVHGVGVRGGSDYDESAARRDHLFRSIALLGPNGEPYRGEISNPFWGSFGASFRWGHSTVPAGQFASLGTRDPLIAPLLLESPISEGATGGTILADVARQSLSAAVDLLCAAAVAEAGEALVSDLSDFAREAADAARDLNPDWVNPRMSNDEFVGALSDRLNKVRPPALGMQSQGFDGVMQCLLLGADRIKSAYDSMRDVVGDFAVRMKDKVSNLVGVKLVDVLRGDLHANVSVFVGDIITYFVGRGARDEPGNIPAVVLDALFTAFESRTEKDPLIAVGHSLGGVILYDLLTSFLDAAPDGFNVDTLVTVGSQVGVIEEMKAYALRNEDVPGPEHSKMPKPSSVGRWINVFDGADILSFVAAPVFEGVEDFAYSSQTGLFSAHSSYFLRASFFERLRSRLYP